MTTIIKAIKKDYTGALVSISDKEDWYKISQSLIEKLTEGIEDETQITNKLEEWRKDTWGAKVSLTMVGNIITDIKILEKAKPNPQAPSQEKDDYWNKKLDYEINVRDVQLKLKGELDQAIKVVELARTNNVPVENIVEDIVNATKLLFGN
jgi:hypothetical protein